IVFQLPVVGYLSRYPACPRIASTMASMTSSSNTSGDRSIAKNVFGQDENMRIPASIVRHVEYGAFCTSCGIGLFAHQLTISRHSSSAYFLSPVAWYAVASAGQYA